MLARLAAQRLTRLRPASPVVRLVSVSVQDMFAGSSRLGGAYSCSSVFTSYPIGRFETAPPCLTAGNTSVFSVPSVLRAEFSSFLPPLAFRLLPHLYYTFLDVCVCVPSSKLSGCLLFTQNSSVSCPCTKTLCADINSKRHRVKKT